MKASGYLLLLLIAKSCPTVYDPVDYSRPGSSVHGISQARILERVAFLSPENLPDPRIEPASPALQADSLPPATWEAFSLHIYIT